LTGPDAPFSGAKRAYSSSDTPVAKAGGLRLPAARIADMAERDNLRREMQELAERSKELTAEHAKIVEAFQSLQKRIEELDRKQKNDSN
jgi:predicted  nucleic acid-binding Zn-ribbon protein